VEPAPRAESVVEVGVLAAGSFGACGMRVLLSLTEEHPGRCGLRSADREVTIRGQFPFRIRAVK
jgi:hypothetical protein